MPASELLTLPATGSFRSKRMAGRRMFDNQRVQGSDRVPSLFESALDSEIPEPARCLLIVWLQLQNPLE
jgi:hypothetical protein